MIGVLAHTSLQKAHASYRHHLKTMLPLLLVAVVAAFLHVDALTPAPLKPNRAIHSTPSYGRHAATTDLLSEFSRLAMSPTRQARTTLQGHICGQTIAILRN